MVNSGVCRIAFASRLAPTGERVPIVGASLLAKGPATSTQNPDHKKGPRSHQIAALFLPSAKADQTASSSGSSACTFSVALTTSWRRMYFQSASSM
ncbi:hypothetical protein PspCFBP13508_08360 [Pseudomonas sp. CFBP13508]|nr:hypothetical protein PspCFBP13508_08360 [Pseudomonas sp. CFBP13508]